MSNFFMRLGLGAVIVFPFYIILRMLYLRQKKAKSRILHEITLCFFVQFMTGLVILVLWPGNLNGQNANYFLRILDRIHMGEGINFVPLRTIRSYFRHSTGVLFTVNIVANVLMFSPIGLCLPLLWQRFQKWWKLLCAGAAFSAGIEMVQLFVGRSMDIDDIILNVAGVMLGYIFFVFLTCLMPNMKFKIIFTDLGKTVSDDCI